MSLAYRRIVSLVNRRIHLPGRAAARWTRRFLARPPPRPGGLGLHRQEASGSALGLCQRSHRRGTPALPEAPRGCRADPRSRGRLPRRGQALPSGAEAGAALRLFLGPGAAETQKSRREVTGTASGEASPCNFVRSGDEQGGFPNGFPLLRGRLAWGRIPGANWAGLGPPGRCLSAFAAASNWSGRGAWGMRRTSPGCEAGSHRPVARAAPG